MSKSIRRFAIVFLSTFLMLTGCAKSENKKGNDKNSEQVVSDLQKISAKEAKDKIDSGEKLIILDVREVSEYDEGHIKDSVLLPVGSIESEAENKLKDKDIPVLVYCRSGNRSRTASELLSKLGYKKVYDFGGIIDWPYEIEK